MNTSFKINKIFRVFVLSIMLCFQGSGHLAQAQGETDAGKIQPGAKPESVVPAVRRTYKRTPQQNAPQPIRREPSLEDVPSFSQGIFLGGFKFPQLRDTTTYMLSFKSLQSEQVIHDWYKAALQRSSWTINNESSHALLASRDGGFILQINLGSCQSDDARSGYQIFYRHSSIGER